MVAGKDREMEILVSPSNVESSYESSDRGENEVCLQEGLEREKERELFENACMSNNFDALKNCENNNKELNVSTGIGDVDKGKTNVSGVPSPNVHDRPKRVCNLPSRFKDFHMYRVESCKGGM